MWKPIPFRPGSLGSESGIIIGDEKYKNTCRVTMEKCPDYYAITCSVYGSLMHTVYCGETEYLSTYKAIKKELANFTDRKTTEDEEYEFYEIFTNKY